MNNASKVVDLSPVQRVENLYRQRLLEDPCDTLARNRLAWCLFMQALHQAGRESVQSRVPSTEAMEQAADWNCAAASPEREAEDLLRDCLRQASTVLVLSQSQQEHQDVENLQGLARLSCGALPGGQAEGWVEQILERLARDVVEPPVIEAEE